MIDLNRSNLLKLGPLVRLPAYDRSKVRVGVVHMGVGNFHRVHQAPLFDDCLALPNMEGWGIAGVGLMAGAAGFEKAAAYATQDNLYTVTVLTLDSPKPTRVIGAMVAYLHAPSDPKAVVNRLAHPDTRIVSLTITEGGYNLDEASGEFRLDTPDVVHDLNGSAPKTVFGLISAGLHERRRLGLPPFTVLSCDNLRRNGNTTRRAILSYARAWDPELADWIDCYGAFPNSMVDRIAPQVTKEDRDDLNRASGIRDLLPATCEPYTKWVVEDRFCAGRPPLERVGVDFRDDVAAFESVKGRLSNAAHVLMCYPSILMGYRYVDQAMTNHRIPNLLRNFWDKDVLPLISSPEGFSTAFFTNQVLDRFANPAVKDGLLRVAHDGAAKINVFHARTISELLASRSDLVRQAFLLATFWRYLGGVDDKGQRFDVSEPQIDQSDWGLIGAGDPTALLQIRAFRGLSLGSNQAFRALYQDLVSRLTMTGAATTLDEILV